MAEGRNDGLSSSPMPLLEIDAYRAAKLLIDRHGDEAVSVATKTIYEASDQGDEPKREAWMAILRAVEVLQRMGPKSGELLS
jgi:hypothetical protein